MRKSHRPTGWVAAGVIGGALALAACAGSGNDTTTSPTTATTSTTASTTATTAPVTELTLAVVEGLAAGIYEPGGNALAAGTYTTNVIEVPITFTIPDGWVTVNEAEVGPHWVPSDPIDQASIGVTKFIGTVWNDGCGYREEGVAPDEIENSAQALIEWLATHPHLDAGEVEKVTFAGHPGYRVEVISVHPPGCEEPPRMFLLDAPAVGSYWVFDDIAVDFIAIEVDGTTLLISVESSPQAREAMQSLSDGFFASLSFGDTS